MEAGSLLRQALEGRRDDELLNALLLDVHLLRNENRSTVDEESLRQHLLRLAQLACDLNAFYQQQRAVNKIAWHVGGDGPVFGLHASNGIPHLRAACHYGANVADEWIAIGLLMQFSYNKCDIVAECMDVDDGQILLIESANVLPDWVDRIGPEACRHRCWIHMGRIHLLEPTAANNCSDDDNHPLELEPALQIWQEHARTAAPYSLSPIPPMSIVTSPQAMQDAIEQCIIDHVLGLDTTAKVVTATCNEYGSTPFKDRALKSTLHKATLTLPRSVADLIRQRPDLVNAAIVAFAYNAENPTTLVGHHYKQRPSNTDIQQQAPQILFEDWVWTTHSFTRTNYAMLRTIVTPAWNSEEYIPKAFGQSLEVRRLKRQCAVEATPHLRHALQIGIRLVTGFQCLLLSQQHTSRPAPTFCDITDRRLLQYWPLFLQKLAAAHRQRQLPDADASKWLLEAWRAGPQNARYNVEPILRCPLFESEIMPPGHMHTTYNLNLTPLSQPDSLLHQQIQRELSRAELHPPSDGDFVVPRLQDVDNEDWMVLPPDLTESGATRSSHESSAPPTDQLDTMLDSFQTFMVDQSGIQGISHHALDTETKINSEKLPVTLDPRVFLHLLKTALDPSKSTDDLALLVQEQAANAGHEDPFFTSDDYDAMNPDDVDGDVEDEGVLDTDVVELMAAMDDELKGTAAGSTENSSCYSGDHEEDPGVAEHARVLTNLLQSLDAGGGGPGPVPNMLRAMGKKPPLITVVDDNGAELNDGAD